MNATKKRRRGIRSLHFPRQKMEKRKLGGQESKKENKA